MIEIRSEEDFGAVCICAVRYCIGRQTYMPGLVMDFIRPLLPNLGSKTLFVMEQDISKADDLGNADIDAPKWMKFLSEIQEERRRREVRRTPDEIKKALSVCTEEHLCTDVDCPYYGSDYCADELTQDALSYIKQLESRVEPVRHGYWIIPTPPDSYTYCKIVCSVCNEVAGKHQTEYCPRCGAKMDLPRPRGDSDD